MLGLETRREVGPGQTPTPTATATATARSLQAGRELEFWLEDAGSRAGEAESDLKHSFRSLRLLRSGCGRHGGVRDQGGSWGVQAGPGQGVAGSGGSRKAQTCGRSERAQAPSNPLGCPLSPRVSGLYLCPLLCLAASHLPPDTWLLPNPLRRPIFQRRKPRHGGFDHLQHTRVPLLCDSHSWGHIPCPRAQRGCPVLEPRLIFIAERWPLKSPVQFASACSACLHVPVS